MLNDIRSMLAIVYRESIYVIIYIIDLKSGLYIIHDE